jgi:hypothetical protein
MNILIAAVLLNVIASAIPTSRLSSSAIQIVQSIICVIALLAMLYLVFFVRVDVDLRR